MLVAIVALCCVLISMLFKWFLHHNKPIGESPFTVESLADEPAPVESNKKARQAVLKRSMYSILPLEIRFKIQFKCKFRVFSRPSSAESGRDSDRERYRRPLFRLNSFQSGSESSSVRAAWEGRGMLPYVQPRRGRVRRW